MTSQRSRPVRALRDLLYAFPSLLARLGLVDREKATRAFDLAVPVMVTGGLRTLLRALDFFMISLALGDAAVAGLEIGFQYWFVGFGLALGVSSGTISVVSRLKGAGEHGKADLALKISLWIALAITIPLTVFTWFGAEGMIGLLTDDGATIRLGGTYLRIVMLSVSFRFWSVVAARALEGSGDTRTPMRVRLWTIPTNAILNAILIFGLGPVPALGVAGAAWGTVAANVLAGGLFTWVVLAGDKEVRLRRGGRQWDADLAGEIVRVGWPLSSTWLIRTFGRFPFLFVLAELGTGVVAAYAIARRVMLLAMMPAWGYSTAASTLVGQSLGGGDEREADSYGWETLRIGVITQALIGGALVLAAGPIAVLFRTGATDMTVEFIRVFGVAVVGYSIARVMRGALRGAGDTLWPLYGISLFTVARIAVAFLALPSGFVVLRAFGWSLAPGMGLGLAGVWAAILLDVYGRAAVNAFRFRSGEWRRVARDSAVA